jgi:phosphoribosylaminoimidazole-succinocarboxamide synthase
MVKVECVARGYLTGSGLSEYRATGAVSGVPLPAGLVEADRLPEPIFTPTTKAPRGEHDAPMTYEDVVAQEGEDDAAQLRRLTLQIYGRGAAIAQTNGIIIADTKVEFGRDRDGRFVLADEVLTPDSSRFWDAAAWTPGQSQDSYDKQVVRDWAAGTGWDKSPPGPAVPAEIVEWTRERYIGIYERITGEAW